MAGSPGFIIAFPYDAEVVEELKAEIPHFNREWREESKTWWVAQAYAPLLKQMFGNFKALIYDQQRMF